VTIPANRVTDVLLPGGWQHVDTGTFEILSQERIGREPTGDDLTGSHLWEGAFRYREPARAGQVPGGQKAIVTGSLDAIVAIRYIEE
jgi:hypothetical protein